MILVHVNKIKAMEQAGATAPQVCAAFRGQYTEDEIRVFMCDEEVALDTQPEMTPAQKGRATKAANKAKREAAASAFE